MKRLIAILFLTSSCAQQEHGWKWLPRECDAGFPCGDAGVCNQQLTDAGVATRCAPLDAGCGGLECQAPQQCFVYLSLPGIYACGTQMQGPP